MVRKRRKRQIVDGRRSGRRDCSFRSCSVGQVRQDESLWDYSMTRVLEDGPCLADPTSSCRSLGTTEEDIPVSHEGLPNRSVRLCMELARALLDPNWKYSSALRTLEELVLEQLMNYGSRAPS